MTAEELQREHEDRVNKITFLGLSGVMSSQAVAEEEGSGDETQGDETTNEKEDIIDNVIQEMEDFGEIE